MSTGKTLRNQLFGIGSVLFLVQVSKQFDLTDPNIIFNVRLVYLASQLSILAIYGFIYSKINKMDNALAAKTIKIPATPSFKNPTPQNELTEMTIKDYDSSELKKKLTELFMSALLLGFLHYKFGYVQPLFLQIFLPFKNLLDMQLFEIHVLNKPAEGTLTRPWKAPNPLGGLLPTEPAAAENTEREADKQPGTEIEQEGIEETKKDQ